MDQIVEKKKRITMKEIRNYGIPIEYPKDNNYLDFHLYLLDYFFSRNLIGKYSLYRISAKIQKQEDRDEGKEKDEEEEELIFVVRTYYGKSKTRTYRQKIDKSRAIRISLEILACKVNDNIVKSYVNSLWKNFPTNNRSEIKVIKDIIKTQSEYILLLNKLFYKEVIDEDPIDKYKVIRYRKGVKQPSGTRKTTLTFQFHRQNPESEIVTKTYSGSIVRIESNPSKVYGIHPLLCYMSSLIVAMRKSIRYMSKHVYDLK